MTKSPLRDRLESYSRKHTPLTISRLSNYHPRNDENSYNQQQDPSRLSKRQKADSTLPDKRSFELTNNTENMSTMEDQRDRPCEDEIADHDSDCGTEASSTVSSRRDWLKDFGKKHESSHPIKQSTGREPTWKSRTALPTVSTHPGKAVEAPSKAPTSAETASSLVTRMMSGTSAASSSSRPTFSSPTKVVVRRNYTTATNRGFLPTKKHNVAATDDGYASVAQLSSWLADDPTSSKKKRHVRRGKNVIARSRKFEKDMENVIVIEGNISRGAVSHKKKWLQQAFHEEEGSEDELGQLKKNQFVSRSTQSEAGVPDYCQSTISVSKQKDWLKRTFKTSSDESGEDMNQETQSEIVTNDAAASLSVSDKKAWLETSCKNNGSNSRKNYPAKAQTDVLHNRGDGREEVASRAKQRFLARSHQRSGTSGKSPVRAATSTAAVFRSPAPSIPAISIQKTEPVEHPILDQPIILPSTAMPEISEECRDDIPEPTVDEELDSDRRSKHEEKLVDFNEARQTLVNRGRANGHKKMQVVNKVYMKKTKFEKWEKDCRRRSSPKGLLKPTWKASDESDDLPSTSYNKKYVSDIAPKKSFEELP